MNFIYQSSQPKIKSEAKSQPLHLEINLDSPLLYLSVPSQCIITKYNEYEECNQNNRSVNIWGILPTFQTPSEVDEQNISKVDSLDNSTIDIRNSDNVVLFLRPPS